MDPGLAGYAKPSNAHLYAAPLGGFMSQAPLATPGGAAGPKSIGGVPPTLPAPSAAAPATSSGMPSLPWSETKQYLSDIAVMFEEDDKERTALGELRQLKRDIAALMGGRELDAKRILQEMQARVQRAAAATTEVTPAMADLRARLTALEARKQQLLEEIMRLRQAKDSSAAALQSLTQQMAALRTATATLMADHSATVPRVRHSLSLYANISSIRWDYDSEAVAGYIAPADGSPVRPFYIDPRTHTPFEIADALWNALAEAHRR